MSSTRSRVPSRTFRAVPAAARTSLVRQVLLGCGVLAPLLYLAMNIVGAIQFPGYSSFSQTVSELSAIGAPSRPLWVVLGIGYGVLVIAFGVGVWVSARGRRSPRVVGAALVAEAVLGFFWPPMHLRGAGTSLTDTLHIAFTALSVPLMLLAMAVGAVAFGHRFRIYSIASLVTTLVFGAVTGLYGPRIPQNLPTPWAGVWERISIAAFLLWLAVLAVTLLRAEALPHRSAAGTTGASSLRARPIE